MIVPSLARLIIREHLYRPIQGKVLSLGRQTIGMTYEQVLRVMRQEGYCPSEEILRQIQVEIDETTRAGKGTGYISDKVFFNLLGIEDLFSIDVSSYEEATIVHNLNEPIPNSLCGQFDFIIDGGTFDHLFSLRVAFENVVKLLKTDGRILQWNAASNHTGVAYLSFGPDLFYDFYILNKFADCKVYIAEVKNIQNNDFWDFYEFIGKYQYSHLPSKNIQIVIVLAEKCESSTWDKIPIQAQYRDEKYLHLYEEGKNLASKSGRRPLTGHKSVLSSARVLNSRIFRQIFRWVKEMISKNIKNYFPLWFRNKAVTVLKEPHSGYRYVGRI